VAEKDIMQPNATLKNILMDTLYNNIFAGSSTKKIC
jgi:hypothetical protein